MKLQLLTAMATMSVAAVSAQYGALDSDFSADGKLVTTIGASGSAIRAVRQQADGKLVVAGNTYNGVDYDFGLARYYPDGSLDLSFSGDGKVETPAGTGTDVLMNMALMNNGKIVTVGYYDNAGNTDVAVIRYNADGSLDNTFNGTGMVLMNVGAGTDAAYSVLIQPDGKIVAIGGMHNGTNTDGLLLRFNTDGSLDAGFGAAGVVTSPFGAGNESLFSAVLQGDGKIVATGWTHNGTDFDFLVARYNTNGTLDASFDTDGWQSVDLAADLAYSVAMQGSKIVVSGASDGVNYDAVLMRFNTDGSLDNTFSGDGIVTSGYAAGDDYGFSVAVQPDNKILLAGSLLGLNLNFALARYQNDGTLDNSFGTSGVVVTDFLTHNDEAYSMIVQEDGRVLLAGYANDGTVNNFAMARYLSGLNVGVLHFAAATSLLVYPNPVAEQAVLEYELTQTETLSIRLVNVQGQVVQSFLESQVQAAGNYQQILSLDTQLPTGTYFLVLDNGRERVTVQVAK